MSDSVLGTMRALMKAMETLRDAAAQALSEIENTPDRIDAARKLELADAKIEQMREILAKERP